jgi:hypothetical protein
VSKTNTELGPQLDEIDVEVRGEQFHLRELTADQYEECLRLATSGEGDEERIDNQALVRFMAERCVTSPADFGIPQLMAMGLKSHRKLLRAVNSLHFGETDEQRYIRYLQSLIEGTYLPYGSFLVAPPKEFEPGND